MFRILFRLLVVQKVVTVTKLIKDWLKDQNISQKELAELLKESPQNLGNKLRKRDLDSGYIRRISIAVNHDFFLDLSTQLQPVLKAKTKRSESSGIVLGDDNQVYVNREQYLQILEENIALYRLVHGDKRKAGK